MQNILVFIFVFLECKQEYINRSWIFLFAVCKRLYTNQVKSCFFALYRIYVYTEPATQGVLLKMVLLQFSQNYQVKTCVGVSFLIKLQVSGLQLYEKRDYIIVVCLGILRNFKEYLFATICSPCRIEAATKKCC